MLVRSVSLHAQRSTLRGWLTMAHAYTPGLTVTDRTVVQRKRLLPLPGTLLTKPGDTVTADTPVACAELPGKVYPINLANQLGISPGEMRDYLVKKEGDPVEQEEVIAENRPFIKWFKTEVRSPITGTIDSISHVTGQVLFREPPRVLELRAYIDGTVIDVHPRQGVTVEATCSLVQGIFGIGGERSGELVIAVNSADDRLDVGRINESMRNKIVVGGAFADAQTIKRAARVGAAGLVVGAIHDRDLRDLLGYDLGVAITGSEQILLDGEERAPLTLVLTEGFGTIPMAAKTFQLFSAHQGQKASISGATQIRAGVIRPEVIIPQPAAAAKVVASAPEREGIHIGDPVRIIRDPLFGRIGQVSGLPPELQRIPTESEVRVLEVRFPDGKTTVIPRANIEVIEGA